MTNSKYARFNLISFITIMTIALIVAFMPQEAYASSKVGKMKSVAASMTAYNEVHLTWSKVKNATGYKIYASKNKGAYKLKRASASRSYTTKMSNGKWRYKVRAYKTINIKRKYYKRIKIKGKYKKVKKYKNIKKYYYSNYKTSRTITAADIGSFTSATASLNNNSTISLKWNEVSNAKCYLISVNGIQIAKTIATSYTSNTLYNGTYTYSITAIGGINGYPVTRSTDIKPVTVTTSVTVPATITSQPGTAFGPDDSEVSLSITAVNAQSYQWYYTRTNSAFNGTAIPGATKTSYTCIVSSSTKGFYYCIVTGLDGKKYTSNVAEINNYYETKPADVTVNAGEDALFRVNYISNAAYQWYVCEKGSSTWTKIDGATESDYEINPAPASLSGNTYKCSRTTTETSISGHYQVVKWSRVATLTVN